MTTKGLQVSPTQKMAVIINAPNIKKQFENSLKDNAPMFLSSILDVYSSDLKLQKCDPMAVVMECLKAATLNLPINKSLGFAYIIPYGSKPQFQMGYKGLIQLAQRTGQYKYLNAGVVYEGEFLGEDRLTGAIDISGEKKSDTVTGYFCYFELVNGFKKGIHWTREKVLSHAKKYSKAYQYDLSKNKKLCPWSTDEEKMSTKTVIIALLSTYGVMSVQMASAFSSENDIEQLTPEEQLANDAAENANTETIDISHDDNATTSAESNDMEDLNGPPSNMIEEEEPPY